MNEQLQAALLWVFAKVASKSQVGLKLLWAEASVSQLVQSALALL